MVKIILSITVLLIFLGCGKRGDIPEVNPSSEVTPAKIDKERIYKF
ncbi:hypothetical protein OA264_02235 [Alphaproteobacteria bacterium]|nr:hypothetical protein [Alphaproteobacteria bacterium]